MTSLWRSRDGSASLEFAMVSIPFLVALTGLMELGIGLFVGNLLEGAMLQASRFGITGGTVPGKSREEQVLAIVKANTFGFVDLDTAKFTTLVYPGFDSIGKPEPFTDANGNGAYDAGEAFSDVNGNGERDLDMGAAGLGGPGDVVVYKIEYTWGIITPLVAQYLGDLNFTSSIAVRNEPF
jgi:Flp pilus assembly protein TadG